MQYLPLHLLGLSSFKTTSKYMKFCLQMNKKGRLVASYSLISLEQPQTWVTANQVYKLNN